MRLPKIFLGCFGAFIFLCGCGHLWHAWLEFHGRCASFDYFMSWLNLGTAIASVGTACMILPRQELYISVTELPAKIVRLESIATQKEAERDAAANRHKDQHR
jgi:hypothetical protein